MSEIIQQIKSPRDTLRDYIIRKGIKQTWLANQLLKDKSWVNKLLNTDVIDFTDELKNQIEIILEAKIF